MLLDSRGHLKLTDLGLCKKIGDVSPSDEPEAILEMMRRQATISSDDPPTDAADGATGDDAKPRAVDDTMAVSGDDGPGVTKRDAKTRREVS